jgi:hypothetical protein
MTLMRVGSRRTDEDGRAAGATGRVGVSLNGGQLAVRVRKRECELASQYVRKTVQ